MASEKIELRLEQISNIVSQKEFDFIVRTYHGYTPTTKIVGRRINYLVWLNNEVVAAIGFSNCMVPFPKPFDKFIGWESKQQPKDYIRKPTDLIINNWRYTIKPNTIKFLGSRILSLACHNIAEDWERKYGKKPVLIYTLIGSGRTGATYLATNWIRVGKTAGWVYVGGSSNKSYVSKHIEEAAKKIILAFPLNRGWKRYLLGLYNPNSAQDAQETLNNR